MNFHFPSGSNRDVAVNIGNSLTIQYPIKIFESNGFNNAKITIKETKYHKVRLLVVSDNEINVTDWLDEKHDDNGWKEIEKEKSLEEVVTNLSKKEQLELYKYMYNSLDCRIGY
jgi:hypothetical protein